MYGDVTCDCGRTMYQEIATSMLTGDPYAGKVACMGCGKAWDWMLTEIEWNGLLVYGYLIYEKTW